MDEQRMFPSDLEAAQAFQTICHWMQGMEIEELIVAVCQGGPIVELVAWRPNRHRWGHETQCRLQQHMNALEESHEQCCPLG